MHVAKRTNIQHVAAVVPRKDTENKTSPHIYQATTWASAQYECEKLGAFLAEPKTEEQVSVQKEFYFGTVGSFAYFIVYNDLKRTLLLPFPGFSNMCQVSLLMSLAILEQELVGVEAWWIGLTDQSHEGRWPDKRSHVTTFS